MLFIADVAYEIDSGNSNVRSENTANKKSPDVVRNGQERTAPPSTNFEKFEFLDMIHGNHIDTSVRSPSVTGTSSSKM